MLAVPALGVDRRHDQAAGRPAIQADRYSHRRAERLCPAHADTPRQVLFALCDAQSVLYDRPATDTVTGGLTLEPCARMNCVPGKRRCQREARIRFVYQLHHHDTVTQELGNTRRDRVEDLGEQRPRADLTLDRGQPFQQRLAVAQRSNELCVFVDLPPFHRKRPQQPEREGQYPAHPAQQGDLLGAEAVTGSRQHELGAFIAVDGDDDRLAHPGAWYVDVRAVPESYCEDLRLVRVPGRPPERRHHAATPHEGATIGVERLREALEGVSDREVVIRRGRKHREELRELLRRPVRRSHYILYAKATTTRVWLWKPFNPWVRANSRYV